MEHYIKTKSMHFRQEKHIKKSESEMSVELDNENKDSILTFKGKKCCYFGESPEARLKLSYRLELVKRYDEIQEDWYADHIYNSLWQCKRCGAFFLRQEVERIGWSRGEDKWTDDYYQVESPEQADKLVSECGGLFFVYDGPESFEEEAIV